MPAGRLEWPVDFTDISLLLQSHTGEEVVKPGMPVQRAQGSHPDDILMSLLVSQMPSNFPQVGNSELLCASIRSQQSQELVKCERTTPCVHF